MDGARRRRGPGAFYRLVQVSRDGTTARSASAHCAIYRRAALDANGGTTLIEHSEDVHTGFDLRRAGWDLRYVPIAAGHRGVPVRPRRLLHPAVPLVRGIDVAARLRKFWATPIAVAPGCCYLSGFCYYVHTALFTFAAPAIPLVMLIVLPDRVRLANYCSSCPSLIYNLVVFPAWHRCPFGPEALMAKLLYGWAHVFALWDILRAEADGLAGHRRRRRRPGPGGSGSA